MEAVERAMLENAVRSGGSLVECETDTGKHIGIFLKISGRCLIYLEDGQCLAGVGNRKRKKSLTIVRLKQADGKTCLAAALGDGRYLNADGYLWDEQKKRWDRWGIDDVVSIGGVRASNDVRQAFAVMVSAYILERHGKGAAELAESVSRTGRKLIDDSAASIREASGLLSKTEFYDAFFDSLPGNLKDEMRAYGYGSRMCSGIGYRNDELSISREVDIEKYFRHGSFVFEEYDGTVQFVDHPEKDPGYQRILKEQSRPLSVSWPLIETLWLGDKDWLGYSAAYQIPLKKPLTKAYAKELAKTFAEKEKKR